MSTVYVSITVGLLCSMGTMLGIIILYEVVSGIFLEEMDKVFFEESHNTLPSKIPAVVAPFCQTCTLIGCLERGFKCGFSPSFQQVTALLSHHSR